MMTQIYPVSGFHLNETNVCTKNVEQSLLTFLQHEYPLFCFKNGLNNYIHVDKQNYIKKKILNSLNKFDYNNIIKPSAPILYKNENPPNYTSLYPKL